MKSKILIFGAGTIGVFIGTRLRNAGFDVTLYGKKRLHQLDNSIHINNEKQIQLPNKIESLNGEEFDVVFVTTKLYDLTTAIKEIEEKGISFKALVFTQNGIVTSEILDGLNSDKVVRLAIFEGYAISGSDKIVAQENVRGWQIDDVPQAKFISNILNEAGIKAEITEDFLRAKAEKLIVNCAVSILSVIENKTIGELLSDPESRSLVIKLIDESYSVLETKYKMRPLDDVKADTLFFLERSGNHYPSLYQDFNRNGKTEVDYFNGQIIEWAKENSIAVPVSENVYNQFKNLLKT